MEDESKVCLGLWSKDTRHTEPWVIDEDWIVFPRPFDGIGRIGDDYIKRFIVPVLRVFKGIAEGNVELIVSNVVEEHIDATEVVCGDVDLLSIEALSHLVVSKDFGSLQEEGTRTTSWVIDLIDLSLSIHCYSGKQLTDFLWSEELTTRLPCIGSIISHHSLTSSTFEKNLWPPISIRLPL